VQIRKATRLKKKIRVAIDGPSGGGKTYTLLRLAHAMKARSLCTKILVVDTENESASLYEGEKPDGVPFAFDTICLKTYTPAEFIGAIKLGEKEGYDCIITDSLSHAWVGEGGILDQLDKKSGSNSFTKWSDLTPQHRKLIDTIIQSSAHQLVSMRSKTEYVLEKDEKGKSVPRKIGMAPVQREGMEYEFTLYGSMDWEHLLKITKSRCSGMQDATASKPGATFWAPLFDWMEGASNEEVAAAVGAADNRTPAERERDQFLADIAAAPTTDALAAVGELVKARGFAEPIRGELVAAYKAKIEEFGKAEEAAKATAAPTPAATDHVGEQKPTTEPPDVAAEAAAFVSQIESAANRAALEAVGAAVKARGFPEDSKKPLAAAYQVRQMALEKEAARQAV
jgi:hypothetical protein